MKRVLAITAVLIALSSLCFAQTPYVIVLFENGQPASECTGDTQLAYVMAKNFNCFMTAIEYQITYESHIIQEGEDYPPFTLQIGTTASGFSESFTTPVNAYVPVLTATVRFHCLCGALGDRTMVVGPNPYSGYVRAVDTKATFVYGYGETSILCPSVPTEESSWGKIKSLYE
jgi:hypothetical protein